MKKTILLLVITLTCFALLWFRLPVADSPHYFSFADESTLFGIPHAMDVLSNLAFFFAGLFGILEVAKYGKSGPLSLAILGSALAFASLFVCAGSAYFHWTPNPQTLIWDRIPMTLGFASVCAIVVSDRLNQRLGLVIFAILVPLSLLTIIGHANGFLDLRPYMLLQFGTLVFILITILIFRQGTIRNSMYFMAVFWYVLAKIAESKDVEILGLTGFISGHTLKHLFAAVAIAWLMTFYRGRKV